MLHYMCIYETLLMMYLYICMRKGAKLIHRQDLSP